MLSVILSLIVPISLKVLEYYLDKSKANKETCVKLKKSYEAQLARIQAKLKAAGT